MREGRGSVHKNSTTCSNMATFRPSMIEFSVESIVCPGNLINIVATLAWVKAPDSALYWLPTVTATEPAYGGDLTVVLKLDSNMVHVQAFCLIV